MKKHTTLPLLTAEPTKIIIVTLLVINLLLSSYVAFFKKDALWLEQLRAGGQENFSLVQQLYTSETYKEQQTQTLLQVLGSMNEDTTNTDTSSQNDKLLDQSAIDSILKDSYIKGDENARFLVLEYSDLLCPYCRRHYEAKTLEQLVQKYPGTVAKIFKHMPLGQPNTPSFKGAEAIECAGMIGGSTAYYSYLDKAISSSDYETATLLGFASDLRLNSTTFSNCINDGEKTARVSETANEARSLFGITGTPGNVVLDRETGKYVVIAGAYPLETFEQAVQNLMN